MQGQWRVDQLKDQPSIVIPDPQLMETPAGLKTQVETDYSIQITIINKGSHTASSVYNKGILTDQMFKTKPIIVDSSKGNDLPQGVRCTFSIGADFPLVIPPSYLVFAIKYQDKEASFLKTFRQIYCFKQPGGRLEAQPLRFVETDIPERENILNHFKE